MRGERSWHHRSPGFAPERAPLAARGVCRLPAAARRAPRGPGPRCRASCFSTEGKQHLRIFSKGDKGQSPSLAEPSSVQTRNTCFSRNHFLPLTFLLFLLTQGHTVVFLTRVSHLHKCRRMYCLLLGFGLFKLPCKVL